MTAALAEKLAAVALKVPNQVSAFHTSEYCTSRKSKMRQIQVYFSRRRPNHSRAHRDSGEFFL
jgi:hypothetical protein